MQPRAAVALALFVGTACAAEHGGERPSPASDAASGTGAVPVVAAARVPAATAATAASAAPRAPDAEVRAACAAAAAAWRKLPGTAVREVDTLLSVNDVIEDRETDTLPRTGATTARWAACGVEGFAEAGLDTTQQRALHWPAAEWVVFPRLNADGPGGQVQVYQRGWIRCQVAVEWDPGDDGDSTYVPVPFHREWTLCWRHRRLVIHSDTVNLGG